MVDRLSVVTEFLASLRGEGAAANPRVDLLTADPVYMSSKGTATGIDAVLKNMAGPKAYGFYKKGNWTAPELVDGVVIVSCLPEPGGVGSKLRCHFEGDKIALFQDQGLGRPSVETKGIKLSAEAKTAINNSAAIKAPILLSYVDETGQPHVSFRASTHAHSDDQLAMWLRKANGGFTRAIAQNPKVALMYRDNAGGGMFQFLGRARIVTDAQERRRIYDESPETERNHDYTMDGVAIIVDLDYVDGFAGRTPDGRSTGKHRMRR